MCKAACRICFKVSLMLLVSYCGNRKSLPYSCITLWLLWSLLLFFTVHSYAVVQQEGRQINFSNKHYVSYTVMSFHCGIGCFFAQNGASSLKQPGEYVPITATTIAPVLIDAKQNMHIMQAVTERIYFPGTMQHQILANA